MQTHLFYRVGDKQLPESAGSKALQLQALMKKNFRIPETYVCIWEAHRRYLNGDPLLLEELRTELACFVKDHLAYAVRSSGSSEDSKQLSFAGQFTSLLNVQGCEAILQGIQRIWEHARSEGAISYSQKMGRDLADQKMAVIVQDMVQPVLSGIAFNRNPITALDEVTVEAVEGEGTLLVQRGVNPLRWVNKWGGWICTPPTGEAYQTVIQEVVDQTRKIAHAFKKDIDLEWVYDGHQLYWVQMRDITSLNNVTIYSNNISKEMLPGQIKPLVWSVNVPLSVGRISKIIQEVIPHHQLDQENMVKAFHYRAYFNASELSRVFEQLGLPRDSLEMMLGIIPPGAGKPAIKPGLRTYLLLPRLAAFLFAKWTYARKFEADMASMRVQYKELTQIDPASLDDRQLLGTIDQIQALQQTATYNNILIPISSHVYEQLLQSRLQRTGIDIQELDLDAGDPDLVAFDPAIQLEALNSQFHALDPVIQDQILSSTYEEFQSLPGIDIFQSEVAAFLDQFGYLSNSGVDFSQVPWKEKPELILQMVSIPIRSREPGFHKLNFEDLPTSGLKGWQLALFYQRASQYRKYRREISSQYTRGVHLFHVYYTELGKRLHQAGILSCAEDVFYLYDQEIRQYILKNKQDVDLATLAASRREEMIQSREVTLPPVIFGEIPPPAVSSPGQVLYGIASSRGYFTGRTKVIQSIEDYRKMESGYILVIPYSDVGLTPLFAKAGAVIAESGGILSHSSIIAREYQIPAVVSVLGALQLGDDQIVTVDGYKGEVLVHLSDPADNMAR